MPDRKKTKRPNIDIQQVITDACTLAEQVEALTQRLEELKAQIRAYAVPYIPEGRTNVRIETDEGTCQVVLQSDHLVLEKGVEAEVLRGMVPKPLWNAFFVMRPAFRPTAAAAFQRLTPDQLLLLGEPVPFRLQPRAAQVRLPR